MAQIKRLLEANAAYARARSAVDARPSGHLAVLTCMDARIDVFAVLGLHLGEAHVIRNAGGRVTDDVRRSLALSTHFLGVDTLVIMQHTTCGLTGVTDEELRSVTGAEVEFLPITNHHENLAEDLELIKQTSYLHPLKVIAGFVYDVESGAITESTRWERPD